MEHWPYMEGGNPFLDNQVNYIFTKMQMNIAQVMDAQIMSNIDPNDILDYKLPYTI